MGRYEHNYLQCGLLSTIYKAMHANLLDPWNVASVLSLRVREFIPDPTNAAAWNHPPVPLT